MLLSQWALLGFAAWTMLLVLVGIGYPRLSAVARHEAPPNSFNPSVPQGTARYQRTIRAHMNCVENLPIFAALVWLGSTLALSGCWFQLAAFAVLPARMGQSVAHIASGSNRAVLVRFYFYTFQQGCQLVMLVLVALHGWR